MSDMDREVRSIFDDALQKYHEGEKKYGELDIMKDPRNFLAEAEAELLDTMVYCAFEISRIRKVNATLNKRLHEIVFLRNYLLRQSAKSVGRKEEK